MEETRFATCQHVSEQNGSFFGSLKGGIEHYNTHLCSRQYNNTYYITMTEAHQNSLIPLSSKTYCVYLDDS